MPSQQVQLYQGDSEKVQPAKYIAWYPLKVQPAKQHMAWHPVKVQPSQTTEGMVFIEGATSQTMHSIKTKCQTTHGMASSEGATSQTPGTASRESAKQHMAW